MKLAKMIQMPVKTLLIFAFLACFIVLAWLPTLAELGRPTGDQVFDYFNISTSCDYGQPILGWLGDKLYLNNSGLFTPSFLNQILLKQTCRLSKLTPLSPLQTYLLIGSILTAVMAYISTRWAGMTSLTSSLAAAIISTAPCSFSRVGHVGLSVLLPVVPTIVGCVMLQRAMTKPAKLRNVFSLGIITALLAIPTQEYYVFFSIIMYVSTIALQLTISSGRTNEAKVVINQFFQGTTFIAGISAILFILFIPKFAAIGGDIPPQSWAFPRVASEQFRYGLMPLTWFIPSPLIPSTINSMQSAGLNTASESYFWSAGSLLIPIGLISAIRRLAQSPQCDSDRRFLAQLLLLSSAIGLLWMTMGGFGTLFAVTVSPVLRSLNRFTVFVYGAAVMYLLAEFDFWLRHREQIR